MAWFQKTKILNECLRSSCPVQNKITKPMTMSSKAIPRHRMPCGRRTCLSKHIHVRAMAGQISSLSCYYTKIHICRLIAPKPCSNWLITAIVVVCLQCTKCSVFLPDCSHNSARSLRWYQKAATSIECRPTLPIFVPNMLCLSAYDPVSSKTNFFKDMGAVWLRPAPCVSLIARAWPYRRTASPTSRSKALSFPYTAYTSLSSYKS
jgi:hypothetical protein